MGKVLIQRNSISLSNLGSKGRAARGAGYRVPFTLEYLPLYIVEGRTVQ